MPDRIERDTSLAHRNMLWDQQYAPFQAHGGTVDKERKTWSHECGTCSEVARSRRKRITNLRRPASGSRTRGRWPSYSTSSSSSTTTGAETRILLHRLRPWIQNRTLPRGWNRSRRVGLMKVVRDSWKVRDAMKMLVAAHGMEETFEAEEGCLLVAEGHSEAEERRQRTKKTWYSRCCLGGRRRLCLKRAMNTRRDVCHSAVRSFGPRTWPRVLTRYSLI
ncbi:hypothetical protein FIBSPDRAFT_175364 [Athelia psychrophila]|uniref:Uncharacterized protein n=1 Tax=Athelia psychrophila TaxID=1759441 RepID=A0A166AP02_9AGAM|nr:hypothetical protein FIBSPDRAFT_175364 [Fibularhizoctonia sp. CBS 109695]